MTEYHGMKKQDLIFKILKERTRMNGLMFGEGTLEILPDDSDSFEVRTTTICRARTTFTSAPARFVVSAFAPEPRLQARFVLRRKTSDTFALLRVAAINGEDPNLLTNKVFFDDLTPLHPEHRLRLADNAEQLTRASWI